MMQQFEELLESTSQCLLTGNWHRWRKGVRCPLTLVDNHGTVILKNEMDLMRVFHNSVDQFQSRKVIAIALKPQELEQSTASTFCGRFDTHLFCNCGAIQPAYESAIFLGREDGQFKLNMLISENTDQITLFKFDVAKRQKRLPHGDKKFLEREYIH